MYARPGHSPQAVDVTLLSILRHRREPFLFNVRQLAMFPRCCCVLWEKPRRRLTQCIPLDHPKAIFHVDFDSGQRFIARACHPFVVDELIKEAKASAPPGVATPICRTEVIKAAISPPLSARSRRETYFLKTLPSEWAELFGSRHLAEHT